MDYIPEPEPLLRDAGPRVARQLLADAVDVVVLVPVLPVCQQSVGLLHRIFDEHDLSTVSITLAPDITRLAKPSLACFVAHPFGLPCGGVGDKETSVLSLEHAYARRRWITRWGRWSIRASGGQTTCASVSSGPPGWWPALEYPEPPQLGPY